MVPCQLISGVGAAVTLQLALGFTLTGATIWPVPVLVESSSWKVGFGILAIGPALGIAAMPRLLAGRISPENGIKSTRR